MKDNKSHLDIDLEFLDNKEAPKTRPSKTAESNDNSSNTPKRPAAKPVSTVYKYKWKKMLLIGGGVFLFFVWIVISDGGSSSSSTNSSYTPPATNSDYLAGGNGQTFNCSDYNYNRAVALRPSSSESMESRIDASNAERARVDAMYVDETSQASIDRYNAAIDSYNSKYNRLKLDIAAWEKSIETYNNFLDTNCSPQ